MMWQDNSALIDTVPSVSWTLLGMSKFQTRSCGVWTGTGGCWSDETTKRSIAWGGDCHNGKNGRVPLASRNLSMLKMLDEESGDCSVFLVRLKLKLHQKLDFSHRHKRTHDWFPPFFFGSQNLGSMKVLHLWVGKTTVLRIHRTWHRHIIAQSAERRQALLGRHRTVFSAHPERTGTARCQDYVASVSDFLCDVALIERSSLTTPPHDLRRIDIYIYCYIFFQFVFRLRKNDWGSSPRWLYHRSFRSSELWKLFFHTDIAETCRQLVLKAARSFWETQTTKKSVCYLSFYNITQSKNQKHKYFDDFRFIFQKKKQPKRWCQFFFVTPCFSLGKTSRTAKVP